MASLQERALSVELKGKIREVEEMAMKVVERFGVVDTIGNPVEPGNLNAQVIDPWLKGCPFLVMVYPKDNRPFFNKTIIRPDIVPGDRDKKIRVVIVPSLEGSYIAEIKWFPERSVVGGPVATIGEKTGIEQWAVELTYPYKFNTSSSGRTVNLALTDYPDRNDSLTRGAFALGIKDGKVVEGEVDALLARNAPRALVLMTGHLGLSLDDRWAKAGGVSCFFVGQSTEGKTETDLSAESGEQ